jgi:hypothetical protein
VYLDFIVVNGGEIPWIGIYLLVITAVYHCGLVLIHEDLESSKSTQDGIFVLGIFTVVLSLLFLMLLFCTKDDPWTLHSLMGMAAVYKGFVKVSSVFLELGRLQSFLFIVFALLSFMCVGVSFFAVGFFFYGYKNGYASNSAYLITFTTKVLAFLIYLFFVFYAFTYCIPL